MLMWMRLLLLLLLCFGFGFATEEEERRYLAMPCHAMPCHAMLCHALPVGSVKPVPRPTGGALLRWRGKVEKKLGEHDACLFFCSWLASARRSNDAVRRFRWFDGSRSCSTPPR